MRLGMGMLLTCVGVAGACGAADEGGGGPGTGGRNTGPGGSGAGESGATGSGVGGSAGSSGAGAHDAGGVDSGEAGDSGSGGNEHTGGSAAGSSAGSGLGGSAGANHSGGHGASDPGEAGNAGVGGSAGAAGNQAGGAGGEAGSAGAGGSSDTGPSGPATIQKLVANEDVTCVLMSDGHVKCWGRSRSLGYGNSETIGDDELPASVGYLSVTATPGEGVAQLWPGDHSCALLTNRSLTCWGNGLNGQLGYASGNGLIVGDDELPSSMGPVSVTNTPGVYVTQIAINGGHTIALLSDGSVKSWGSNWNGELGVGGNIRGIGAWERPSDVAAVSVTNAAGVRTIQVVTGFFHTCALLADRTVKCWGSGTLGYATSYPNLSIGDDEVPSSVGPVSVTTKSGVTVQKLFAGDFITCALLSDNSLKCWGSNSVGSIGLPGVSGVGGNPPPSSFEPISVTTDSSLEIVDVGAGHGHVCVLLSNGTVKCWGENNLGQLGRGNTVNIGDDEAPSSIGPVSITTKPGVVATQLAVGGYHTCVLLSDQTVKCWGRSYSYGDTNDIGDDELPSSVGAVSVF